MFASVRSIHQIEDLLFACFSVVTDWCVGTSSMARTQWHHCHARISNVITFGRLKRVVKDHAHIEPTN